MIVTGRALPRRTILRGAGAALALPLLDCMVPAFAASRRAAAPVRRMGVVYVPNGMAMKEWTPAAEGGPFELTPVMRPLAAHHDRLTVLSGLCSTPPPGASGGVHARASTRFLTGIAPKLAQNSEISANVSIDQMIARQFAEATQLGSLELAVETRTFAGSCDVGYSCAYTNTIAWRSATTPLPMENNPRVVFEQLFGDGPNSDAAARRARLKKDRSLLDALTAKAEGLRAQLGPGDRHKLTEYLDTVRDVERRIQQAEAQRDDNLPAVDQPAGIPSSYDEHVKLLFDLQVLAYRADISRVITFMLGREFSGLSYPNIGVYASHHAESHHAGMASKLASVAKINTYHVTLLEYYLSKLAATPEGDASLLDSLVLLYGAGMSDSNAHSPVDLPILLVGGKAPKAGGQHIRYAAGTPLTNLHLVLLDKFNVPIEKLGDSTGRLELASL